MGLGLGLGLGVRLGVRVRVVAHRAQHVCGAQH